VLANFLLEASAAPLRVQVQLSDGRPLQGVVVTAHALEGANKPSPPVKAVVDQVDLAFAPDLSVIPVGSTVEFPNSDVTSHQVYSFSSARRFQLPLYRGKMYPPVLFDKPGVVTLGCNIHDDMLAYVLVTDAQYYGRTGSKGEWTVADAAAGKYRIDVWHPRMREPVGSLATEVQIKEGSEAHVTIEITKALRPGPITGRPHSWDAY